MTTHFASFENFRLNLATGELRRNGTPVGLELQPARALVLLVSRPGELVTRDELRRAIWDGDTFVDFDRGLNYCIRHLRAALGDDARQPRFIQTLPRQGYRFIAEVHDNAAVEAPDVTRNPSRPGLRRALKHLATASAAALLTAFVLGGAENRIPAGFGRSHHELAVAAGGAAHDAVFGDATAERSSHHRLAVALTRPVHDLVFD